MSQDPDKSLHKASVKSYVIGFEGIFKEELGREPHGSL